MAASDQRSQPAHPSPADQYEIFEYVLGQRGTQREAAEKFGLSGTAVARIVRTAEQGAVDALAGRGAQAGAAALAEANAEIKRLRALSGGNLVELDDGLQVYASTAIEARFLYDEIFRDGCYDIPLPAQPFVVDAGANIGLFTLFVKQNYPAAEIIAFEPMPATLARLKQNIELHRLSSVTVHEVALGQFPESGAEFTFYPMLPGNSTRHPETKEEAKIRMAESLSKEVVEQMYKGQRVVVDVEPLSSFLPAGRTIDLLKIDVEGAEVGTLLGIGPEHWPLVRNVVLEVPDLDNRLDLVCRILTDNGLQPTVRPAPLASSGTRAHLVHATRP